MKARDLIATWAVAMLGTTGCSPDGGHVSESTASEPALILSDTAFVLSSGGAAIGQVAYISLPPGTIPSGIAATIRNRRTAVGLTIAMAEGGFDPVPIAAVGGDVLEIEIRMAGGAPPTSLLRTVPGKRPPRVVRTQPPRGKRDVALNTTILVVFSEPIDARTLTDSSLHVLRGGVRVAGQLAFGDSAHLTAVFTPLGPLQADTDYRLIATQDVRDLDGEPLEAPLAVDFGTIPSTGASTERIAFADWSSISVINVDGTGLTSVIDDDGQGWRYMSPAWSPDGSKIAFGSSRDGGWDIYVINADGSGLRRLTNHVARDDSPAWSPDGTRIAFTSDRSGSFDIHVINADGSGIRRVTDHPAEDGDPTWSPDGSKIAFTSNRDGLHEIYVINVDGSGTRRLTDFADQAIQPNWSPDGTMIVFTVVPTGVWVMSADGTEPFRLTQGGGAPTWSPDAARIVYAGGNLQNINKNGGDRRDLGVFGYEPAWSPAPR